MQLFYASHIQDSKLFLSQEETNHAKNVLRLKEASLIKVVDGKGTLHECKVISLKGKEAELEIISSGKSISKHPYYLHIAIAPTKNIDRIEWFVEKVVEIGIDEISFIQTERSERKHINIERMDKIAIAAMKQSIKAFLPKLNEMRSFSNFLTTHQLSTTDSQSYIAHLEDDRKLLFDEIRISNKPANYVVLIGPEGDFSPNEIAISLKNGFQPVSLGSSRLRTETAGIVTCSTINQV